MLQVVEQWQVSIYHNKDQICKRSRGQSWGGVYVCWDLGAYGVIGHKGGGGTEGQIQSKYSYRLLNLQRLPIIDYTSIVVLKLLTTTIEV